MSVDGLEKLTARQKEILRLLLGGFDTKSVARELDISVHTVTEHLRVARRHLGVSNSREAARLLGRAEAGPPIIWDPAITGWLTRQQGPILIGNPALIGGRCSWEPLS